MYNFKSFYNFIGNGAGNGWRCHEMPLHIIRLEFRAVHAIVPKLLIKLVDGGLIMPMQTAKGEEYRLQTVESQSWYDMYRQQESELKSNPQRLEVFRSQEIQQFVRKQVAHARITQGTVAEPRMINLEFGWFSNSCFNC